MASLFRKKDKPPKTAHTLPATPSADRPSADSQPGNAPKKGGKQVTFDEFGASNDRTGARTLPARQVHLLTPPSSPPSSPAPLLPPKYSFCPTFIPPNTTSDNSIDSFSYSAEGIQKNGGEFARQYGFLNGIGRGISLSLGDVGRVIKVVGEELESRALATPMLFSNQALELSQTRTKMLIHSFMDTISTSGRQSHSKLESFLQDIKFAKEHELAWLFRWALSRITRVKEGARVICHGVMEWEAYEEWRGRERVAGYPADTFPYMKQLVPPDVYTLILSPLFHLLSRFAAHSHLSGLTPHALSSLFAPLLFDIPTSIPALASHTIFVRSACATEHLLLAYIRSSSKTTSVLTDLPSRLKEWVHKYPAMLASDAELARGSPRKGARIVRCDRASRTVRAYTLDLVSTVEGWANELPPGEKWEAWDRVVWKARRGNTARPQPTSSWKRRMAVKTLPPPPHTDQPPSAYGLARPTSNASMLSLASTLGPLGKPKDEEEEARYGSLAGKEWTLFEEGGFDSGSTRRKDDFGRKLQFDLNESAKISISERRRTMDWSEFASDSGGFTRTDPLLSSTLSFAPPISSSIAQWPKDKEQLSKRLHKAEKQSTPFNYDTTPQVGGRVYVEEAWVDVWCDLMVGGGWMEREERTFREANWVIMEYKARPSKGPTVPDPMSDPRTSSVYILFEERVPLEYQHALADPKQKKSFGLFSPKTKKRQPPTPNSTPQSRIPSSYSAPNSLSSLSYGGSRRGQDDFDKMLSRGGGTKKVSLNRPQESTVWHQSTAPPPVAVAGEDNASPIKSPFKMHRTRSAEKDDRSNFFSSKKGLRREKSSSDLKKTSPSGSSDKIPSPSKKERERQKEQNVDFEVNSASGLSSVETSPKQEDDKWMDILVSAPGRLRAQDYPAPVLKRSASGLPASPHPPFSRDPTAPPSGHTHLPTPEDDDIVTPRASQSDPYPEGGAEEQGVERQRSIKRKAVPQEYAYEGSDVGGFEPVTPGAEDYPPPSPTAELDEKEMEIHAPTPRRDRDTIHGIVAQYSSSSSPTPSHPPPLPRDDAPRDSEDFTATSDAALGRRDSGKFSDATGEEEALEPVVGDDLKPPEKGVLFDLTPGREPSPARYRHGEPLHFVGEEPELEEDTY
ncbi:hypothetical protein L202_03911 [Cryptococcus amylolentus CBS 6039]|uniref:Meiotically up-regulated protein Msb1/Mug8 domain-containing protein n=2 Tax=Cryptococcus amylolentus CBS 6039 TaxID=1295533 RepID=A0A1E3HPK9_9TREE|nr:hypothetical protein L202_03911 [Cryptococcus amylolentus CBS 6039]ODN78262.1 hypothetical protein L202_03911 [Cryptococcus amylolentus CBS 6039]